jgi:hypothetical protein
MIPTIKTQKASKSIQKLINNSTLDQAEMINDRLNSFSINCKKKFPQSRAIFNFDSFVGIQWKSSSRKSSNLYDIG